MSRTAVLLIACMLSAALPARAQINPPTIETSKQFDKRTVYYNVFTSTDLPAEMAARYNIARADDRVVVIVALRDASSGTDRPQAASITATYSDLMDSKKLEFSEVRDEGGINYIAQLRVSNRQLLRFDITLLPIAGGGEPQRPLQVTFTRRFAVDN